MLARHTIAREPANGGKKDATRKHGQKTNM